MTGKDEEPVDGEGGCVEMVVIIVIMITSICIALGQEFLAFLRGLDRMVRDGEDVYGERLR